MIKIKNIAILGFIMTSITFLWLLIEGYHKYGMKFRIKFLNIKINKILELYKFNTNFCKWNKQRMEMTHREAFKKMALCIREKYNEPRFHYANESNMISKIVLGVSMKEFKDSQGVSDSKIKECLTKEQMVAFEELELLNTKMLYCGLSIEVRKEKLKKRFNQIIDILYSIK